MDEKRERSPSFRGMSTNRRFINPNRSPSYHTLVHTQDKQPHLGSKKPRIQIQKMSKKLYGLGKNDSFIVRMKDISLNPGSVKLVVKG